MPDNERRTFAYEWRDEKDKAREEQDLPYGPVEFGGPQRGEGPSLWKEYARKLLSGIGAVGGAIAGGIDWERLLATPPELGRDSDVEGEQPVEGRPTVAITTIQDGGKGGKGAERQLKAKKRVRFGNLPAWTKPVTSGVDCPTLLDRYGNAIPDWAPEYEAYFRRYGAEHLPLQDALAAIQDLEASHDALRRMVDVARSGALAPVQQAKERMPWAASDIDKAEDMQDLVLRRHEAFQVVFKLENELTVRRLAQWPPAEEWPELRENEWARLHDQLKEIEAVGSEVGNIAFAKRLTLSTELDGPLSEATRLLRQLDAHVAMPSWLVRHLICRVRAALRALHGSAVTTLARVDALAAQEASEPVLSAEDLRRLREAEERQGELDTIEGVVEWTPVLGDLADAGKVIRGETLSGKPVSKGERIFLGVVLVGSLLTFGLLGRARKAGQKALRELRRRGAVEAAEASARVMGRYSLVQRTAIHDVMEALYDGKTLTREQGDLLARVLYDVNVEAATRGKGRAIEGLGLHFGVADTHTAKPRVLFHYLDPDPLVGARTHPRVFVEPTIMVGGGHRAWASAHEPGSWAFQEGFSAARAFRTGAINAHPGVRVLTGEEASLFSRKLGFGPLGGWKMVAGQYVTRQPGDVLLGVGAKTLPATARGTARFWGERLFTVGFDTGVVTAPYWVPRAVKALGSEEE